MAGDKSKANKANAKYGDKASNSNKKDKNNDNEDEDDDAHNW